MLNTAVIMGRLTAEPELRVTPSGTKTVTITVAVDRQFTQGEERQADFIDVVLWRQKAEFVCSYFKKGDMIAIQGSLQTRIYKDKHGYSRKVMELVAKNVSFCGNKGRGAPEIENTGEPSEDFREIPEGDLPY